MPSRDLRLLLLCACTELAGERRAEVDRLLTEALDWERILELARYHRVFPLLYLNLKQSGAEGLPEEVMGRLAVDFYGNQHRMMRLTAELLRINQGFRDRGVTALALKGPALASLAYGNVALRPAGDLDILVDSREAASALEVLKGFGYYVVIGRPEVRANAEQERAVGRFHYNYNLRHDQSEITVELHTRMLPRKLPMAPEAAEAIASSAGCSIGGQEVRVLNREENLIFLCVHGGKHGWSRLEWVVAVAELLRRWDDVNESALLDLARRRRAEMPLYLGVLLARRLLDCPGLPEISQRAAESPVAVELAEEVAANLDFSQRKESERELEGRFQKALCHRWSTRLHWAFFSRVQPGRGDFRWLPWTFSWSFIYYLVRQVRLLVRQGRRLLKSVFLLFHRKEEKD